MCRLCARSLGSTYQRHTKSSTNLNKEDRTRLSEPPCTNEHFIRNVGNSSILVRQREILQMSAVKDGI